MSKRPVSHVGFSVSNLERSRVFYRSYLGFEEVTSWTRSEAYIGELTGNPGAVIHTAIMKLPDDPLLLELVQYDRTNGHAIEPASANPGAAHLGLNVENLDSLYDSLLARGAEFVSSPVTPTVGPNAGGRAVLLLDPDGFRIELVQTQRALDGQQIQTASE